MKGDNNMSASKDTNTNKNKVNGLRFAKSSFEKYRNNNCYTYAINQRINPYTKKPYASYGHCQPGILGGKWKNIDVGFFDYKNFPKKIKADLRDIGYDLIPSTYEEYVEDKRAWKIAYCYEEYGDYHFYRQNKDGTWSHKQGRGAVKKYDDNGELIYNPMTCARGKYNIFVGFYIIKPIN